MIDPLGELKGTIAAYNGASRALEWWRIDKERGEWYGNPSNGGRRKAGEVGVSEREALSQQGWVRFNPVKDWETDFTPITDQAVIELIQFCNATIGTGQRNKIFSLIREWRIYKEMSGRGKEA